MLNHGKGAQGRLGRVPTCVCGQSIWASGLTPSMCACPLQNVSFSLSPGKVTALVGPSGSGKSSCVNILENFYPLEEGRVLLDGKPISAYDHKFLHRVVCGGPLLPSSALALSKLFSCELCTVAGKSLKYTHGSKNYHQCQEAERSSAPDSPPEATSRPTFTLIIFLLFFHLTVSLYFPPGHRCVLPSVELLAGVVTRVFFWVSLLPLNTVCESSKWRLGVLHSLSLLAHNPLCKHVTIYFRILPLMGVWVISWFLLLPAVLTWTILSMFPGAHRYVLPEWKQSPNFSGFCHNSFCPEDGRNTLHSTSSG